MPPSRHYFDVDDPILDRLLAIALSQKRFIRSTLKQSLWAKGLWADLLQEYATAAVAAWRAGYDPDKDFRLIKNLVQRYIYRFLKSAGFVRQWNYSTRRQGRGYGLREIPRLREEVLNQWK